MHVARRTIFPVAMVRSITVVGSSRLASASVQSVASEYTQSLIPTIDTANDIAFYRDEVSVPLMCGLHCREE